MKKRIVFVILAAICACVWAVFCIPIHPQFYAAAFSPSFQYYDAVLAYFDQREAEGPSEGDTIYLYTASSFAGGERTLLFCPWVEPIFRDVGTAGSSDWSVNLRFSTLSWDGKTLSPSQAARPSDSVCVIQPDKNTALGPPYSPSYKEDIPQAAWGRDETLSLHVHAATEDSAISPNASAIASAQWSGEFYVRRKLWPSAKAPFSAAAEETYLSNGK